jgi:hypothetical protein
MWIILFPVEEELVMMGREELRRVFSERSVESLDDYSNEEVQDDKRDYEDEGEEEGVSQERPTSIDIR